MSTQQLVSIGNVATNAGRLVSATRLAAAAIGVKAALSLNGVDYFDATDAARIIARLNERTALIHRRSKDDRKTASV